MSGQLSAVLSVLSATGPDGHRGPFGAPRRCPPVRPVRRGVRPSPASESAGMIVSEQVTLRPTQVITGCPESGASFLK